MLIVVNLKCLIQCLGIFTIVLTLNLKTVRLNTVLLMVEVSSEHFMTNKSKLEIFCSCGGLENMETFGSSKLVLKS